MKTGKKIFLIFIVIFIIYIIYGISQVIIHRGHGEKMAILPMVEGLGLAEAESKLDEYGFKYTIIYDYNNEYEDGVIISQDPKPISDSHLYNLKENIKLVVNSKK